MLTPSNVTLSEYNSALLNEQATHIRIVFPVQNVTFTDDDISANGGITLLQVLNTETDLIMGNAVAEQITINFLNNGQFVGIDWSEEFRVDLGVYINGATEWVTIGYFKGKRPDRVARVETIVFTALDRMQKFDLLADDFIDSLTFPMTMAQIYSALCTYIGVQSVQGNEIADSMALSYAENPFRQGLTCRQILAWIAEANCCYAKIDNNGKVKLVWFTDHTSDYSIDGNSYFNVELAEVTASAPDSVRIASTDQEGVSLLYPLTGVETYQIIDNPFLLDIDYSDKVAFITELLTRFGNITPYIPTNLNAVGNWMVETGDIIEVGYDNGSTMNMPIFARTMQWNGGCEDVYECSGQDKRSEMTESARVTYEEGGKLAQKYTVRSGIDITDAGIQVSGGKYVKIVSGGTFDVDSTNFKINSQYKRIIAGKWQFDDFGMVYFDDDENTGFEIAENDDGATNLSGVYYKYGTDGNLEFGQIIISPGIRSEGVSQKSRFIFQNQYNTETQTMTKYFYPVRRSVDGFISALGSSTTPWDYGYITNLRTESGNVTNLHTDYISCIPDSQYPTKNFTQFTSNIRVDYAHETYSAFIRVSHNTTSCGVTLISRPNGIHGLQSSGYWNGSSFTPDSKNMVYRDTDGKVYFDGYTIEKSVPSNAVFTDTWRPVVDNLTSTDTDKSLSANQGKFLNDRKIAIFNRNDIGTSYNIDTLSKNGWFELRDASEVTVSGTRPFSGYGGVLNLKTPDNVMQMQLAFKGGGGIFIRGKQSANVSLENVPWYTIPNGIVDNLTSTSTTAALSANQGKTLNDGKANTDGSNASGTWGISITGNAATVNGKTVGTNVPANAVFTDTDQSTKFTVVKQISRGSDFDPIQSGYFAGMTTQSGIDSNWWHILSMDWANDDKNNWISQLALPTDTRKSIYYRTRHSSTTNAWIKCLDANNYTDYTVTKTGTGASGTWGINVTGSAGSVPWSGVSSKDLSGFGTLDGIYIPNPGGGRYVNSSPSTTGAIKITLPKLNPTTMIRFYVDIYTYDASAATTYLISGYAYNDNNWYNVSAKALGGNNMDKSSLAVRFGHDGSKNCIWIGETSTVWKYPQICIRDILAGYNGYQDNGFATGWSISIVTSIGTYNQSVTNAHTWPINATNALDANGVPWSGVRNKPIYHQGWATSITVDCAHAFLMIGHRFRVSVWLPGDAGISISVDYYSTSSVTGYYKEVTTNSMTFGESSTATGLTITRSGHSFTAKSTNGTTQRTWTAFGY